MTAVLAFCSQYQRLQKVLDICAVRMRVHASFTPIMNLLFSGIHIMRISHWPFSCNRISTQVKSTGWGGGGGGGGGGGDKVISSVLVRHPMDTEPLRLHLRRCSKIGGLTEFMLKSSKILCRGIV